MTDEERRNRNPKPEVVDTTRAAINAMPEVFIKDLEWGRVYLMVAQRTISTMNYFGFLEVGGVKAYCFSAPRIQQVFTLRERPDGSGTLEDGRGVKVTIRKYEGPDA